MNRNRKWELLLVILAVMVLLSVSFTPSASTQVKKGSGVKAGQARKKPEDPRTSVKRTVKELLKATRDDDALKSSILIPSDDDKDDDEDEDPDLPPWMAGKIDKEAYLRLRADYVDLLRGRPVNLPFDPRERAIRQMEQQEGQLKKERGGINATALVNTTNWMFLGPAPIPLGQTSTTRVPVSGRTISIAVHPTDENTVYVGTAQGGLYKSTNGGANWSKLFEFQLESLAIGAVTIDPTDSSIVYVGTGEPNLSADSFGGRGLYIIRNANSASPTISGPFRLNGSSNDVFSGAIGRIVATG
jgi:hypothetical protein